MKMLIRPPSTSSSCCVSALPSAPVMTGGSPAVVVTVAKSSPFTSTSKLPVVAVWLPVIVTVPCGPRASSAEVIVPSFASPLKSIRKPLRVGTIRV